jgi:DNA-binding Xre family transcriptional regulator
MEENNSHINQIRLQAKRWLFLDTKIKEKGLLFSGDTFLLQKERALFLCVLNNPAFDKMTIDDKSLKKVFSKVKRRFKAIDKNDMSVLQSDKKNEAYQSMLDELCASAFFWTERFVSKTKEL